MGECICRRGERIRPKRHVSFWSPIKEKRLHSWKGKRWGKENEFLDRAIQEHSIQEVRRVDSLMVYWLLSVDRGNEKEEEAVGEGKMSS